MTQIDASPETSIPLAADTTDAVEPENAATSDSAPDTTPTPEESVRPDMIESPTPATGRQPTRLMVDLSRAMQSAAENARDETMARFVADSKTVVEEIQAASTVEAANLRRRADDDVAAVREWSKTEIARIREETEARIATRKTSLDGEIDAFGAVIDARVAQVTATVETFKVEMDEFFERLLAQQDPTRIATMAETMPEPPDLMGIAASIAEPTYATFDPLQPSPVEKRAQVAAPEPTVDPETDQMAAAEAALAARLDFAAAEAEALAFTGDPDDEGTAKNGSRSHEGSQANPAIVAGLAQADAGSLKASVGGERATTRVVVVGLVSVASIATFKRGLSRSEGVSAVSVTSGPDGEFVFSVEHEVGRALGPAILGLHGFEARVTSEANGTLEVTAHDPDSGD